MKVKVTEIECNADELKSSNTVADGIIRILRNCFNGTSYYEDNEEGEDGDADEEQ